MDFDPKKDYYNILGVEESATTADIKKEFKKQAVKHHPDRWGSTEKFQEINEAYQILSDEWKRQQYDMFRKGGFWGGNFGGFDFGAGGGGAQFDFGGFDMGDLIWSIFGGSGFGGEWARSRRRTKGDDLEKMIEISFDEAYLGTKKKIAYSKKVSIAGLVEENCSHCQGSGRVTQQAQTMFGTFQTQANCPECNGLGKRYKKDGKLIAGDGLESKKEILELEIPAGIKSGSYLKYSGKGNEYFGDLPAGDLYIKILVKESNKYHRQGDDLLTQTEVDIVDLVLGKEIELPHPEGKIKVKIPKGTQIGEKVRVANKGFGKGRIFDRKGDMIVSLKVNIPKKLSKESEKLREKIRKEK